MSQQNVSILVRRDDKRTMLFDGDDWGVLDLQGIEASDYQLFTSDNGVGDGAIVTGKRTKPRAVEILVGATSAHLNGVLRRQITAFFNPKHTYELWITYQGVTRWIDSELAKLRCPEANPFIPVEARIAFTCPAPYLKSASNYGRDIAGVVPLFPFPFISPTDRGFACGAYTIAKTVFISNNGDQETYCKAVFKARGDGVLNPKLVKDGKYVRVLDTLNTGDILIIDLANRTVYKNGVNIINLVDRASSFVDMQLNVGHNSIGYDADDHDNLISCKVYYNELYNGM